MGSLHACVGSLVADCAGGAIGRQHILRPTTSQRLYPHSPAAFPRPAAVFLVAQRAIPEGAARLALRVITVLSWVPCRFVTSAYFAYQIYIGYTQQFLSPAMIALGTVMFLIIFGMQIMWTQRLVAGRLIDEVLRSTLGIEWRKDTSTSNEKFVNEGL